MALWTPAEIDTAIWLDADDASTITIGTGVSEWRDKSGNARHAAQATGSLQPALTTGGLNGKDVITWDGTGKFLTGAYSRTLGAQSVFAVFKYTGTEVAARIFTQSNAGTDWQIAGGYIPILRNGTTAAVCSHAAGTNHASVAAALDTPMIFGSVHIGTAVSNRKNGGTEAVATFTASAAITRYLLGIATEGFGGYLTGFISEVVVIDAAVDTETRQRIEGYLAWKWGTVADLPADHPYKSAAPTVSDVTALLAILSQPYALEGTLRCLIDQPYGLTITLLTRLEQIYGLQLLAVLAQHYGDVPVVRQYLEQYYGSADLLRRLMAQPYGDALQLRQSLVESWNLPGDLLAIMEMRYSISEGDLRALMSYNYDLSEYTLLRQKLEQIYIAGSDAEEVQEPLFSVTTNNGESLKPHHINIEIDEGEYAIKGEIHLADQNDFLLCKHIETEIIIPIDSTEYHLLIEGPRQSRPEWGRIEYYIPLASKTILLDSPYAAPIDQEFTGALASVIVAGLAAIKSITVIWQLIDWYIPTGVLTANNESPLSIIRRIVNAVGGILQSSPAGELICLPEYPISTTGWETATPDFYLTDMDNFFSVDSTSDIREGYNRFLISDKVIDESGLILEQVDIDENTKDIYVYQVPWNPLERVILHTSGGVWVSIVAEGITTEEITEIVEIIAGEGMTQKPFYSKISHDYKETELGLITINEDKTVSTALSQNSLVEVVYNTKYWKFRVRDAEIEKVQFFPEAIVI